MTKHILSLRYDGLDAASHHGIGTAGSKQVIGGAQILLGAHAHYYAGGKVPDRVDDRGAGFKNFSTSDAARARSSSTSRC